MAQLQVLGEADDEFPPVSVLLGQKEEKQCRLKSWNASPQKARRAYLTTKAPQCLVNGESSRASYTVASASAGRKEVDQTKHSTMRRQRPLGSAISSLLLPLSTLKLDEKEDGPNESGSTSEDEPPIRRAPRRKTRGQIHYEITESDIFEDPTGDIPSSESDESYDDLSDFIVHDSASEEELRRPPRSLRKNKKEMALNGSNKHQGNRLLNGSGGDVQNNPKTQLPILPTQSNSDVSKHSLEDTTETGRSKSLLYGSFDEPPSVLKLLERDP